MTSFLNTFGGSSVSPSDVAYASYSFSSNLTLYWPAFSYGQTNVAARFMNLTATAASLNVYMPDATLTSVGQDIVIFNAGSLSFNVVSFTGVAIATIAPGQTYYILLNNNTTQTGGWQTVQFGVGTGSASAAALAGAGLLASAGLLEVNFNGTTSSASYSITMAQRAILQIWTGGSGVITLPTAASVGNGFFFPLANNGTGSVTVTCSGGNTIDGNASSVFAQTQSGFVISNGSNWYTVGKGLQNNFSVTILNLNVAGSSNVTETSAQAQNIIQQFTGALTSNISVNVPATAQIYYVFNNTSGSYTLTFKTSAGSGISVPQGTHVLLYCDGTNVVNAFTSSFGGSIALSPGSATSPNLSFTGSPTTGLFSPATNQLAITAGGYEVMNFVSAASSVNYLQAAASAAGNPPSLSALGSDSSIGIDYISQGSGTHNFEVDSALQFQISGAVSAVNYLTVDGSATGANPNIFAQGSDTNIGINLTAKGTGSVNIYSNGFLVAAAFNGSANSVNYFTFSGATTGNPVGVFASGSDANIGITLNAKGTGTVQAATPSTGDNSSTIATTAYVQNNLASYATLASPALTGSPTAPTASSATNSTQLATTAYVQNNLASYAPLNSAHLTGAPQAPTPGAGDATAAIATTFFVNALALTLANGTTAVTQATTDSSTLVASTAFANPAQNLNAFGSKHFPGGLIVQWNTVTIGANTTASSSFGFSFPSACFGVLLTTNGTNTSGSEFAVQVGGFSTASVAISNPNGAPRSVFYVAIGS